MANLSFGGTSAAVSVVLLAVLSIGLGAAPSVNAGNIFEDDWVPGKSTEVRPATAPITQPVPKVVPPLIPPSTEKQPVAPEPLSIVNSSEVTRKPIPAKDDLDRSRTLLKEAFAEQLADRAIPARHKLAETLLKEAEKAGANQSDQFALFAGAINAAKESASLRMVVEVADQMAKRYVVDSEQVKLGSALSMPLKADTSLNTASNVLAGLELLDTLIAADEMPVAARLCSLLRPAAVGDAGLMAVLQKRQQEIDILRTAHDRAALHMEKLKTSPDDASANSAVGGYLCFYAGNWQKGLAMLAKGSDVELKKLAIDDLSKPTSTEALLKLADGWWNAAAKQAISVQPKIHQHAAVLYSKCSGDFTPLQRIKIDKRIADAGAVSAVSATAANALRDAISRQKMGKLNEFTGQFAGKPSVAHTPWVIGEPLEGDIKWEPIANGYSLSGEISVGHNAGNHGNKIRDRTANVVARAGFHLEGGTVLITKGTLDLRGELENPIVLKNVHVECELTGAFKAAYVIFDHCTFTTEGPYRWTGGISGKYELENCLLMQSNFPHFGFYDDGIKLNHCTFAGCKFPERENKPGKDDDSFKTARHEWSRIADCEFLDCEISASVYWLPQKCNFFNCKPTDAATYFSPSDLVVELGLPADDRDRILKELKERTTKSGAGRVSFSAASGLYQTHAFPKP